MKIIVNKLFYIIILLASLLLLYCGAEDMWSRVIESGSGFHVTYNANGASGNVPVDSNTYNQGDEVIIQGNTGGLILTDCVFNGWNTAADGSGTTYSQADFLLITNSDVTLYANWVPVTTTTYTVTYNSTDATGGIPPVDTTNYLLNEYAIVLDNTGGLYRNSYVFSGWNTVQYSTINDILTNHAPGELIQVTGNLNLYPMWNLPIMLDDHFTSASIDSTMFIASGSPSTSGTILTIKNTDKIQSRLFKIPAVIKGVVSSYDPDVAGSFNNFSILRDNPIYNKKCLPTGFYFSTGYNLGVIRTNLTLLNADSIQTSYPQDTTLPSGTVYIFIMDMHNTSQTLTIYDASETTVLYQRITNYELKSTLWWYFQLDSGGNNIAHELDRITINTIQQGILP